MFWVDTFYLNNNNNLSYSISVDPCYSNPCYNGGTCFINEEKEAECECMPHYTGEQCENGSITVSSSNIYIISKCFSVHYYVTPPLFDIILTWVSS